MPGGNRMGPNGMGPMTGRGAGFCAGYSMPGFENWPMGIRAVFGFMRCRAGFAGRGRGFRNRFFAVGIPGRMRSDAPFSKEEEMNFLKEQAGYFEKSLEVINARLSELSKE